MGNAIVIDRLIAAGADLKKVNYLGEQPLHIALSSGDPETAMHLLTHHADKLDVNVPVRRIIYPLNIAISTQNIVPIEEKEKWGEVIQLLKAQGAKTNDELNPRVLPPQ